MNVHKYVNHQLQKQFKFKNKHIVQGQITYFVISKSLEPAKIHFTSPELALDWHKHKQDGKGLLDQNKTTLF